MNPPSRPTPGRMAVLLGVLFGVTGMSTSAVTVALAPLGAELGVGIAGSVWVVSAYTLALAVATPVHGRLADTIGIRAPLCSGVALTAVGAVGAALAPTFAVLVLARVVQGAGAAAVPVLATALLAVGAPTEQRGAALGRLAGLTGAVGSLGPVLGGLAEAVGSWRTTLALPALAVLALPALLRAAPSGGSGERLDRAGAVLVAATVAGVVLLLQSPSTGLVVAAGGAAAAAVGGPLLARHVRRRPEGFLVRDVVTDRTVLRSSFAAAAVPASWFALLISVPVTAASWGWSPLLAGSLLVPAVVVGALSPPIARRLLVRLGPRWTIAAGCAPAALALLLGAGGVATGSAVPMVLAVVLVTTAFGIVQPSMVSAVDAAVPPASRGVALGVATLVFQVGGSVGAALLGGLVGVVGTAVTLCLVAALPATGLVALLRAGDDRPGPASGPRS